MVHARRSQPFGDQFHEKILIGQVFGMHERQVEELPQFYAKRTLLNEIILPEDIANACFVFISGLLHKSTGNVLNVDGGVAMAFVR